MQIVATAPAGERAIGEADLSGPTLILLGGEGAGLPDTVQALADVRLRIPMRPPVESLNVAVAAGVILYEAYRQRHGGGRS